MQNNPSIIDFLNLKARMMKLPISGIFELSPVCNLDCKMCYVRRSLKEVQESPRKILSVDDWKRLADEALEAGTLFLLLTGGEPFLWPHFKELYEYLSHKGFLISINSNGTMIDEETVNWLKKFQPARINITLYGASNETYQRLCGAEGMYDRVSANIKRLQKAGIPVKLNCSMTPYNIDDMSKIIAFAKECDLYLDMSMYMFPPIRKANSAGHEADRFTPEEAARYTILHKKSDSAAEEYKEYLTSLSQGIVKPMGLDESCYDPVDNTVKCSAGNSSYWITWDGLMLPCGMVPQINADIKKVSLHQAWEEVKEKTQQLRLSGICERCKNKKICHPCLARAFAETGEASGVPKYLCSMSQAMRNQAEDALKELSK